MNSIQAFRSLALFVVLLAPLSYANDYLKYPWPDTDFDISAIDLSEITSGGPPKDGIPPIDSPKFDTVAEAANWIDGLEPVIAVVINDKARAYPLQIMTWHEIVNDTLNDIPVSVTFCPLCNASIVFDRRLEQQVLDFGTTGLLRKSDLVMYDRQTESWWQQFTGSAIVGQYTGSTLQRIPSSIVSFTAFADAWPDGEVLNRETGIHRSYGRNPYAGYDNINNSPFLFFDKPDGRLPPMERVLGVHINQSRKIYPFSIFDQATLIEDTVADTEIVVIDSGRVLSALDDHVIADSRRLPQVTAWQRRMVEDETGQLLSFRIDQKNLVDQQTGSVWNPLGTAIDGRLKGKQLRTVDSGVHFAFAWLSFNPQTDIYQLPDESGQSDQ